MLAIKKVILKVIVRGSDRRQKKMDSFWKFKISLEERLEKALTGSVLRGKEHGESNLYDTYENERNKRFKTCCTIHLQFLQLCIRLRTLAD